eukprot:6214054-Pleurochrysis_carterae.AAC.1
MHHWGIRSLTTHNHADQSNESHVAELRETSTGSTNSRRVRKELGASCEARRLTKQVVSGDALMSAASHRGARKHSVHARAQACTEKKRIVHARQHGAHASGNYGNERSRANQRKGPAARECVGTWA